jgi:hypothetical protein
MRAVAAAAAFAAFAAAPAEAQAPGGARQTASITYTTTEPGAPTGFQYSIDFKDPANPGGKPYSIARIVTQDNPGFVLDTTVPAVCTATDAELLAAGAAGCPQESRIGGGTLVSDTGGAVGPFPRIIENRVDNFNGGDHIIGVADSTNAPLVPGLTRIVTRSPISGDPPRTTFDVPGFPGSPPPDSYTAVKSIRLLGSAIVRDGRPAARTPPTCPDSGHWTIKITFVYRDGVTQRVDSPSACGTAGGSEAPDRTAPLIRVRGLPRRSCVRGTFPVRVRATDDSGLRRVGLRLDGRRIHATSRARFKRLLRAGRLRPGIHRVTVRARDTAGNRARKTARFRRCPLR